jgi:hypothetical protein
MKKISKPAFLLCIFVSLFLFAKDSLAGAGPPPPPGGGSGAPPCWPPPCIPIDGGVGFLIAAGVLLGGWKIYSAYKKKLA